MWNNKYFKAINLKSNKYKGSKMLVTHCEGDFGGKKTFRGSFALAVPITDGIYSGEKIVIDGEQYVVINGYNFELDDIETIVDGLLDVKRHQVSLENEVEE